MPQRLSIATCQFAEDWDPTRNARIMCDMIARAARQKADIVHFHECALSGYGKLVGTPDYDWDALKSATASVLQQARRSHVWVVFGSSHPLAKPHKPHNSVYIVSSQGRIVDRYDKRFCTTGDLKCYSPGDHYITFKVKGLTCSSLICYDARFPELYRDLARKGVRVVFHSFHNARWAKGKRQVLGKIIRPTLQSHAGINQMWISAPNSTARTSLWPSVFINPDGLIANQLTPHRAGLMVNEVNPSRDYYDACGKWRDWALRGRLNSGRLVRDARSRDRKCY